MMAGSGTSMVSQAAVDLAYAAWPALLPSVSVELRDEGRLRPAEQLSEHLADFVRVVVGGLLAHDHEVGFSFSMIFTRMRATIGGVEAGRP